MRTSALVLPMIPETWEDVPWCVSLTLLMQRAQGEKRGVYSVPFFPHMAEEAGEVGRLRCLEARS